MNDELVKSLKKWLKKAGNSYAKVAVLLGYEDSASIRQWIRRNSIPNYQKERVRQIIKGEKQQ
jgi:ABC-type uncharacterized transport system ATPase subunit